MEKTPKIYGAINAVMKALTVTGIAKGRESSGPGQNFKFRGIDEVMNALSAELVAAKLVMLPRIISRSGEVRQSNAGKPIFVSFVEVEFDLVAVEDGSVHVIRAIGEAMDSSDKSTNKAMSAAYKYAALQAFCIPTAGMDDADATTHELADVKPNGNGATKPQQAQQPQQSVKPQPQSNEAEPPPPDGWSNWGDWTNAFIKMIEETKTVDALDTLLDHPDNRADAGKTKRVDPAMHTAIGNAVKAQRVILTDTPPF